MYVIVISMFDVTITDSGKLPNINDFELAPTLLLSI